MHTRKNNHVLRTLIALFAAILVLALVGGTALAADRELASDSDPIIIGQSYTKVSDIEFKVGEKGLIGVAMVTNQNDQPLAGALVSAAWTFPDGSVQKMEGYTARNGQINFVVEKTTGLHKLEVYDVSLGFINFNPAQSQLIGTITVQ